MDYEVKFYAIKRFMFDLGLKKRKFCKLCGISKRNLNLILHQRYDFQFHTLYQIAKAMNVDVFALIEFKKA